MIDFNRPICELATLPEVVRAGYYKLGILLALNRGPAGMLGALLSMHVTTLC
jgi:hypothetical protein